MIQRLIATVAALPLLAASPLPGSALRGMWENPDRTVTVRIDQCGRALCGTVVRAAPDAQADAREGGYPRLIGLQIMTGYEPAGPHRWKGRVLVPDLGRSFSSHIDLVDGNHVRVAGCVLGQHLCQSQVWQRV